MRRMMITLFLAGAAATGAVLMSQPASAAAPTSKLVVTVTPEGGKPQVATLTCAPAGGTHKQAAAACKTLATAGGDPAAIAPTEGACTMDYSPVTATVMGTWKGHKVNFKQTYSNNCNMVLATGDLFKI
ncbi:hypothetical protein Val02_68760 [Virgisporangium aliadipatigenens]|uniref:Subtilisin inhibitor domain-containing protein n=1 Tax=Virgisporangium aliadipatigenens TaxID=741659 RepID=A0A8J4DT81_9ACTN|nr:SSI family serine proteinase inhibitor [Virgisporangium aliadipatigenens]GIJ49990.1 hypothetical protein Val02_68760 [Virgisporangium aliadipatigenens]